MTIFAARRVVPPLFIAAAERSAILRKESSPEDTPPPLKGFSFGADFRKVRTGPGSVLEEPGFPGDQVKNAFVAYKVVLHIHNKTGMRLRAFICTGGFFQLTRIGINVVVPLGRPFDSVVRRKALY